MSKEVDLNAEIAVRIMNWEVDRALRLYRDPRESTAGMQPLPDFLGNALAHHRLLWAMENHGYTLLITLDAPDPNQQPRAVTARYLYHRKVSFEATASDERLAICLAALKAFGVEINN